MPEGDTLENVARALKPSLEGRTVQGARLHGAPVRAVEGRRVHRVYAVGKHLYIEFEDDHLLRTHLGMRGSWHRYPPGAPWRRSAAAAGVVLTTDTGEQLVCFRPRQAVIQRAPRADREPARQRLGPDLTASGTATAGLAERARGRHGAAAPVSDVLLDQGVAAGIGNIYKCEALFECGVHPETPLGTLTDSRLEALYEAAARALQANVGRAQRRTRHPEHPPDGGPAHWVYRRHRRPCLTCGADIAFRPVGGPPRPTWFCPRCQPEPDPEAVSPSVSERSS